jgi:2-polyprenyl-6-methoxyphenol hydroxylase-like FAD-dependent oxidoreductase
MKVDVLVVGAGPVGLTMAAELARYGLSVRIIDQNKSRTDKSKALVLWARTLELLDRMAPECAERFITAGLKVENANIFSGEKEIAHIDLGSVDSPYKFVLMIPQSETERLLEEQLAEFGVKTERQLALTEFEQGEEGVVCSLVHSDGSSERVEASWLIGCDGAHSTVRHRLSMSFEGNTMLNDWILADLHMSGVTGPPAINIYWHAQGVLALFPLEGTRYRVIADLGESSGSIGEGQRPAPTLDEVQQILDIRGPKGVFVSDPVWMSSFSINERKVTNYRSGRVFLAGDAAHVHSPAGGQGMNTGMQDACNLAWKLALVERGLCLPEPLLTSYSDERSAIAKLVLEATGKATAMAVMQGGVKQSIRNHIASLVFGFAPVRHAMANVLSEVAVGYSDSSLKRSVDFERSAPAPGKRAPIRAGEPAPGADTSPRFGLFATGSDEHEALLKEYQEILEPRLRAPYEAGGLWLVRPDGYVALRAKSGDVDAVRTYLKDLCG